MNNKEKVKKSKKLVSAGVFIAAILPCLFLLLQGNIWIVVLSGVMAGLLAEITAGIGKFRNKTWNLISYIFFTQNLLCGFLPIWVMREFYFQDTLERGMSIEFCDTLRSLTPAWVLAAMMAGTVICSVVGTLIGQKLIRKHLEKAGMV